MNAEGRSLLSLVTPDGNEVPAIRRFEVRTPTLPPATHTNVYILGRGDLVVVDPASPYPEEREALREAISATGEHVAAIFLTHQHLDHVSGAAALKRATGAPIWAHPSTARRLVGRIAVDRLIDEGERVPAGGAEIETVFTPGHAPGHLCLLDGASRALVCGDMVASIGTILVDADDDGDMAVYLDSLARMRTLEPRCLLPAHGPPIWNADDHLAGYIAHREMREAKVRAALGDAPRSLDELVPVVYADADPAVWPLAKRSLRAHLIKLANEGAAIESDDRWRSPILS
jgi:ribonuclease/clavin/mitogillin